MADTDYGTDLATLGLDLDPSFALVEQGACVAQGLAHRLMTPATSLFYDPEYESLDLRLYLSGALDDAEVYRLRARVEHALRSDERVDDVDVDVTFLPAAQTLTVTAEGSGAGGPFRLVVVASAANVAILEAV